MGDIFHVGQGLFAASGAVFTLGGFLLNVKQTAIFHRQLPDGTPLSLSSKYYLLTSAGTFGSPTSEEDMRARVDATETDEIWGCFMVVGGTLLWGYGETLLNLIRPATNA